MRTALENVKLLWKLTQTLSFITFFLKELSKVKPECEYQVAHMFLCCFTCCLLVYSLIWLLKTNYTKEASMCLIRLKIHEIWRVNRNSMNRSTIWHSLSASSSILPLCSFIFVKLSLQSTKVNFHTKIHEEVCLHHCQV